MLHLFSMHVVSSKEMTGTPDTGRLSGTSLSDIMIPDGKVYDYSLIESSEYSGYYICQLDEIALLDSSNIIGCNILTLANNRNHIDKYGMAISISAFNETFAYLCNQSDTYEDDTMALTAAVTLGNGEVLYLENAIFFDQRVDSYHGSDSYGAGVLQFYFLDCSSNRKSMSYMDDYQKIGYFSQQLRTYDIKRLQIENFSVDFDIFPTAATIGSMFNTLAEKTDGNVCFPLEETV